MQQDRAERNPHRHQDVSLDDSELETDARPGTSGYRKQPTENSENAENGKYITHDHGDGTVTRLSVVEGLGGNVPNIQIGSNNVMIVDQNQGWRDGKGAKKSKSKASRQPIEVPNRPLSDSDLDLIAGDIGKDYKRLSRQLGLTEMQIDQLYMDYKDEGTYEIMYQTLRKWQKMGGASLTVLFKALQKVDRTDIMEAIANS